MKNRKTALTWGSFLLVLFLVLLTYFLIRKYASRTYSEGHFSSDEPGLLIVSYDPAFYLANSPNTPRVGWYPLPKIKEATGQWNQQKKWFAEYQRSLPPPGNPESQTPRLGGVNPIKHWIGKAGTLGYNAFLIRSEGSADYYRINVCRRGVIYVMEEFRYTGEDFVTVMRGEDWYVAFTKRFNNIFRPVKTQKGGGR